MKKVIVSVMAVVALLTSTYSTAFALCEKTPLVSQAGRTATIYGDLSNPDSYSNELQKLLLDPAIDGVYVLDPTLDFASDSSNSKGVNEGEPQGGPTYHTHRITKDVYKRQLASCRVELLIEIGQILQLCGADKSKVRRIEEKYTPLAQYIRFAHGAKSVVLITLHGKIGDFFLDQGHGLSSFI